MGEPINNYDGPLFDIIKQKDDLIKSLKGTNDGLNKLINRFGSDMDEINKQINTTMSKISTNNDIDYIINSKKALTNKVNLLTEHNKKLTQTILNNNIQFNNFKNIYYGLSSIYVSRCNNIIHDINDNSILNNKLKMLEDRIETIQGMFKCKICFSNTINIILEPCLHIYICKECIDSIIENTDDSETVKCPVCNESITKYNNIYLPV
tara:strand:- start:1022 stop:1645 length:624 start_codon:yes stop_codon:yes gene_type:complete